VDLLEFSVTSIPCQNNVLCSSIIPKATESETVYSYPMMTCAQLSIISAKSNRAVPQICECCTRIRELLGEQNIVDYIASNEFKEQKLPVQTAMSDTFQGFGNFCRAEFGIDPILCKPHSTVRLYAAYVCCVCF
jgi:hypothetical protein